MTLGAVLMLGGMNGSRSDELSGSVGVNDAASPGGFALPSLPENWADLPFRLTATENVAYNSNIFSVPIGAGLASRQPLGDFTSTTTVGMSTAAHWYGQQFFFDGDYGSIRYLHQVDNNANVYSFSAGDNWTLTSRCSGLLSAQLNKTPSTINEQVGGGINYTTTTALNESGKCLVGNGYSLIFNSGWTKTSNSNSLNAVNNSRVVMLAAGIEYAFGPDTLTALATLSDSNFSQRNQVANAVGLANTVDYHHFTLSYSRQLNPNWTFTGQVGIVGVTNAFGLGLPKTLLPTYSVAVTWAITPKVALTASGARSIAPPTTVLANAQETYDAAVGLSYQATPKLNFSAGGSVGYSSSAFTPALPGTIFTPYFTATDFYGLHAAMTYTITPFMSAALAATYTERVANHSITPQDVITVSLNYRPY